MEVPNHLNVFDLKEDAINHNNNQKIVKLRESIQDIKFWIPDDSHFIWLIKCAKPVRGSENDAEKNEWVQLKFKVFKVKKQNLT